MELILAKEANGIFASKGKLYFYDKVHRFFEYDFNTKNEIDPEEYFKLRFGSAYRAVLKHYGLSTSLSLLSGILEDGSVITHFFQNSWFYKFNNEGKMVWKTEKIGNFDTVYAIAIERNSIWCAFPTNHTIKRYSLETFEEEVSIGDEEPWSFKAEVFDHPEDVYINRDTLYVSDMGNKRVCKVDLKTYEVTEYLKFNEHVWGYMVCGGRELVFLDSGVYVLDN